MRAPRSNMKQRGGTGRVLLDHEQNTLGLEVRTTRGAELLRDLKAISGGERSFVTAAFITALAQCIAAPFYCLDEARPCRDHSQLTEVQTWLPMLPENQQC